MQLGKLWGDAFGQHPHARSSWVGPAAWFQVPGSIPAARSHDDDVHGDTHVLGLSVPCGLDWLAEAPLMPRALLTFLPWRDSGIGLLTMTSAAQDEAVVAVLDVAGRNELAHLHDADANGQVAVAACSEDVSPMFPLLGLTAALSEAGTCRRLAAREFAEAVESLRWLLRTDALFPMLGTYPHQLELLTLNVCQPL